MYTVFNDEDERFDKVEEPDPSLNYTYADYLQWKFEERLELIKGKIFKMSAPNRFHQTVCGNMHLVFGNFLERQRYKVFISPFDVRLPVKNKKKDNEIYTVVQPDICVVCDETKLDERGCCGAPDLMIEILSPGNSKKEIRLKHGLYEESGVKEYWIVNPVEENLFVYLLQDDGKFGDAKVFTNGDLINTKILPGLTANVSEFFEK
jgi:Uma2 family endonuclease